jgi:hypothetical protein
MGGVEFSQMGQLAQQRFLVTRKQLRGVDECLRDLQNTGNFQVKDSQLEKRARCLDWFDHLEGRQGNRRYPGDGTYSVRY